MNVQQEKLLDFLVEGAGQLRIGVNWGYTATQLADTMDAGSILAIAAVLIVISLVARLQLSQTSAEVSALEDQYAQLQEDQTRLRIDYESAFNLTEIEDYAIHELGMQKPRSDQLYYISSSDATDTAVVLDQNAAEPLSLADRLGDFFSSIVEYFR